MRFSRKVVAPLLVVAGVVGGASCSSDESGAGAGGAGGKAGKSGGTGGASAKGGGSGTAGGGRSGATGGAGASAAGGGGAAGEATGGTDVGGGSGADEGGAGAGGVASDAITDGYESGSRLRAVLDVAGNAKRFVAWHDSELDTDCRFALDAAGTERCLPDLNVGFVAFGDDQCETQVVVYGTDVEPPRYVSDPEYEFTCGAGAHYLAVGATLDTVTATYYTASNGDCLLAETIGSDRITAELGASVADSIFVAANGTEREPRDARVAANVRTAADGSREVASFEDLEREAECNPFEHFDSGYACVPWDRAYLQTFFADDTCETPAAYHPGYAQQTCGRVARIVQASAPGMMDTFFEIGAELDAPIYQDNGASCAVYDAPAELDATFYAVGEAVPWSSLAPFVSANEGSGRMRQNTLRVPSGAPVAHLDFYDTTLESLCTPQRGSDSERRCLPRTFVSLYTFADAECTEGLLSVPAGTDAPAAGAFISAPITNNDTAIFSLVEKIPAPAQIWHFDGMDCVDAGIVPDDDWYSTESHAPSEFMLVTREVE